MKLYKYRSIEEESFKKNYDALKEGYIWFADVLKLNDKSDSIVYYGGDKEYRELEEFYYSNENKLILEMAMNFIKMDYLNESIKKYDLNEIEEMINLLKESKNEKISNYLISKGESKENIEIFFEYLSLINEVLKNTERQLEGVIEPIIDFNGQIRKKIKVFSMCESFDIPSMWAYYGANNNGFCIEYDFSKVTDTFILENLKKVKYVENRNPISYITLFKSILLFDENSIDEVTKIFEDQLLTKDFSWKHEREWRIIIDKPINKYYIDLVSAIYIDENIEKSNEAIELINLAKQKCWKIFIRRLSNDFISYKYETME